MAPKALSDQWVMVFAGSHGLADLYAEELRSHDIPVFTPDRNTKLLNPLDFGGNVFDISVLVPLTQLERARAILAKVQADELADPAFANDETTPTAAELELRALRNRIAWCGLLPLFGPYGLWLALRYFREVRELPQRLPGHVMTLVATLLCLAQSTLLIALPLGWIR